MERKPCRIRRECGELNAMWNTLVAINYIFISYCNTKHSQLAGTGSDLFLNTRYTLVRYISVWKLLMFI